MPLPFDPLKEEGILPLSDLFRRSLDLKECLNYCHRTSSISDLPPEVLSQIFNLAINEDLSLDCENGSKENTRRNLARLRCLVTLGSVCYAWYLIVKAQAELWTNIVVTPHLLGNAKELGQVHLRTNHIQTFLQRSRQRCLHILIDARNPDDIICDYQGQPEVLSPGPKGQLYFMSQHMHSAILHLLPHINRWQSLTIVTSHWQPMRCAMGMMNPVLTTSGAPALESLHLQRDYGFYYRPFQPRFAASDSFLHGGILLGADLFPRLKVLTLDGVHASWDNLGNILSGSLETLKLRNHCVDVSPKSTELKRILEATTSLETLHIENTPLSAELPADYIPVYLPSLRNLSIGFILSGDMVSAFQMIDAPNVNSLTIANTTDDVDIAPSGPRYYKEDNPVLEILSYEESELLKAPVDDVDIIPLRRPRFKNLERLIFDRMALSSERVRDFMSLAPQLRLVGVWGIWTTHRGVLDFMSEFTDLNVTMLRYSEEDGSRHWYDYDGSFDLREAIRALSEMTFSETQLRYGYFTNIYFELPLETVSKNRPTKRRRLWR